MRVTGRAILVVAVAVVASIAPADELTTVAGKKVAGKLVGVDPKGVTFQAGGAPLQVPNADVQHVEFGNKAMPPATGTKFIEIELTDGSVLRGTKFLLKGKVFEVELLPGPTGVAPPVFRLPMTSVFSVLRGAEEPKNRDDWKKLLQDRGKRDLYVIRQPDRLDFVAGTVIEGTAAGDAVVFEKADGMRTELRLSRATGGLVFNQIVPPDLPPAVCKVVDVTGNFWVARGVALTPTGLRLTTVAGVEVEYPALAAVVRLDYSQGNVAYLSDLEPQVVIPPAGPDDLKAAVLNDHGRGGDPLELDGKPVPKGVWVNAPSDEVVMTYTLNGDYAVFLATVAVPVRGTAKVAPKAGGVKLTVEADGRALFAEAVRPTEAPRPLRLDVKGAKQLRLTVEPLVRYEYTQLILAEARVQK